MSSSLHSKPTHLEGWSHAKIPQIIFQQQQKPQAWLINGLNNMFLSNKINNINNIKTITQEWIYINGLNNMFLFDNIGI